MLLRALGKTVAALAVLTCAAQNAPTDVKIQPRDNGFTLLRNGEPYFIKGAGGSIKYIDALASAGGNSLRVWSTPSESDLDAAQQKGISVLVGLNVDKPRKGFDYTNSQAVQLQLQKIVQTVRGLKAHPAVLMWALGNELELNATTPQRIQVWKALDQLARAVKAEDPNHPVIAVLAGAGDTKLRELDQYAPSLDAVGINTYGGATNLPDTITKQGFKRPYIVTEYGAHGHWEVPKTTWGAPIEDTSSEKEDFIIESYTKAIANRPQCLGSYVFLWGQKQEKTHTWYGLFLPDGTKLGGVDAMQLLWTGKWPPYRCPVIDGSILEKAVNPLEEAMPSVYKPGAHVNCSIYTSDPTGEPVTLKWEVRKDVSKNPSTGGDAEPATPSIEGSVAKTQDKSAEIVMPSAPGDYRIFLYVYNQHGGAAAANLPVQVK